MKAMRSPPHNTARAGGSHPDLSKLNTETLDPQITLRKRKQPADRECQCSEDIKAIRSELLRVTTLLENYVGSNALLINKLSESIVEVKKEILDLKTDVNECNSSTKHISEEQKKINSQFEQLQTKVTCGESKIKALADALNKIDPKISGTKYMRLQADENIIREVQERKKRECIIIIVGVAEPAGLNIKERLLSDETEVLKVIKAVKDDIPRPEKIFRLGKYNPEKL